MLASDAVMTRAFGRLRNDSSAFTSSFATTMVTLPAIPSSASASAARLGRRLLEVEPVDHVDLLVGELGRERRAHRELDDLVRHLEGVAARVRSEDHAAACPLRSARRTLAGATGALLAPRLLAAAADLAAGLGAVRARRGARPAGCAPPGAWRRCWARRRTRRRRDRRVPTFLPFASLISMDAISSTPCVSGSKVR